MGLLWHSVGYEWRYDSYWADASNGEYGSKMLGPWTSTYTMPASALVIVPSSFEELREAVAYYGKVKPPLRVVGSGHSWSATGYTDGTLIDVRQLSRVLHFDSDSIEVESGMKVQDAVQFLTSRGFELHGVGSIRAQAIGGVVSQGVHGAHPDGLNRHVVGLKVILWDGSLQSIEDEGELFMWRSSMGMLGVIASVTFRIFPQSLLRLERSPIKSLEDLDLMGEHLDPKSETSFTGFLYPSFCGSLGWKRVGFFVNASSASPKHELKNQTDFGSRLQLHFNDHMHPAMQYFSRGLLGLAVSCMEQILADWGHSTLLSGPDTDILHNDGLIPQFYEIIDYEYMIPTRHCKLFARELLIEQRFGRVLIPVCLRLMRAEMSCLSIAEEDSCIFAVQSMRGMAYTLDVLAMEKRVGELGGRAHFGKVAPGDFRFYSYKCMEAFKQKRQKMDPHNIFLTPYLKRILDFNLHSMEQGAFGMYKASIDFVRNMEEFHPILIARQFSMQRARMYAAVSWLLLIVFLFFSWRKLSMRQSKEPSKEDSSSIIVIPWSWIHWFYSADSRDRNFHVYQKLRAWEKPR